MPVTGPASGDRTHVAQAAYIVCFRSGFDNSLTLVWCAAKASCKKSYSDTGSRSVEACNLFFGPGCEFSVWPI